MSDHHELSPSHYNAWADCVLWESDGKQSEEASAGTKHHAEMEKGLNDENYEPDSAVARWAVSAICELAGGCKVNTEVKLTGDIEPFVGIYGTTDVFWVDGENVWHFADLKSFSDGSQNYFMQLEGYACLYAMDTDAFNHPVVLHVLHGGSMTVETRHATLNECYTDIFNLLNLRKDTLSGKNTGCVCRLNHYCQYCAWKGTCNMVNNAIMNVSSDSSINVNNGSVAWKDLTLPKKLVVCDMIEHLIKSLKDEAKAQAIANGGVLTDGDVTYEIKERAGRGKVRDLKEVAAAIGVPQIEAKDGTLTDMHGISVDDLLAMCELSKTAFVAKMKEVNADIKSVPKKNIEAWCASFYEKGEPNQYLARAK